MFLPSHDAKKLSNPTQKNSFGRSLFKLLGLGFIFLVGYLFGLTNNVDDIFSSNIDPFTEHTEFYLPRRLKTILKEKNNFDSLLKESEKNIIFHNKKCLSNPIIRDNIVSPRIYDKVENISAYWYHNLPSLYEESVNYATWTRKKTDMHRYSPLDPGGYSKYELFLPLLPDEENICSIKKYGGTPHRDARPGEDGQKYLCSLPSIEIDSSEDISKNKIRHLDEIKSQENDDEPCTIFSIGSDGDWSFEEDILKRTSCVIETFDCTIKGKKAIIPDQLLNTGRLHLHKLCLGNPLSSIQGSHLQYRDLFYLAKYTNHTRIDVLKMDIEGFEYSVFNNLLDISEKPELELLGGLKENRQQSRQPPMSKYLENEIDNESNKKGKDRRIESGNTGNLKGREGQIESKDKFSQELIKEIKGIDEYDTKLIDDFRSGSHFPPILPNQIATEFHYQTQFHTESWWWRERSSAEIVLLAERLYQKGYRSVYAYNNEACAHCKEITLARFNC